MSLPETTAVPSRVRNDGDGAERREPQLGLLDRPLAALLRMDAEKWAWAGLLIVSLLIRLIGLGDRSVSHDESLHTLYSWKLYDGQGYQHQPMMHGPLKFELTALVYFILGVSDWTSRLVPALFGLGQVWLAWLTRRWLGRTGAFLLAVMFSISPALLYHSRYIRDEIMLTALLVLLAVGLLRYLETRSTNWLYAVAATLALALATMEASFIFGAVFGIYLILSLGTQLWMARWPDERRGSIFRMAAAVSIPAVCFGLAFLILKQNLFGALFLGIGVAAVLVALAAAVLVWRNQVREFPEVDLIVLLGTLVLPFLSAVILKVLGWQISQFTAPSQITPGMITQGALVLVFCFALSILIGYLWLRDRWLIAAGFFWAIELLLFSTFLTNGQGIFTGLIGSLGYWIDQQEVMRGNQPWFYFFMQVPLYEFLPLVLSIGAAIAWLTRGRRTPSPVLANSEGDRAPSGVAQRDTDPRSAAERVAARGARIVEAPAGRLPVISGETRAVALFLFWTIGTWIVFTYVGEKMPWHVVYFATPMALLGAWGLGRLMDAIDWRAVRAARGLWLFLLVPLFLVALKNVLPTSTRRPFVDVSVDGLSVTIQWVFALIVTLALAYLLLDRFSALGWAQTRRMLAVTLSGILLVLTIAVSLRFSFVLYDYATEPMVYAHGTPDIKLAMAQVEEISRKIAGDHALKVAYDDDSTWPLEWYLRDYNKRAFYGENPSREMLDAPVVIAGDKNLLKVRPYLGDRFYEFNYRLVWWPRESYRDVTPARILEILRDPVERGHLWDIIVHRRYTLPTVQWDPVHRFSLFVRKDVAAQVWNWGGVPAGATVSAGAEDYLQKQRDVASVQQLGQTGIPGTGPGQFNNPRAVTIGPDGNIYVADSGNHRIQVFSPDGRPLRQFGSMCKLIDRNLGCQGDGRGQFNEPWGIAVSADGSIFVADTWNSRIQKFGRNGNFIQMWGTFESTGGELGKPNALYGPRSLVIGKDGNLYVMDTGNKRVQVFTLDGGFVAQYGGGGVVEGRFEEATGLAQDAQGNWYVADTWNQRIQKFDSSFGFTDQWAINGWSTMNATNKPFLAVDSARGLLYATDPENYRVLVFGLDGDFRYTFGLYGRDNMSFSLPTGLAVAPDGKLYVADGDAHRVMVFPPPAE